MKSAKTFLIAILIVAGIASSHRAIAESERSQAPAFSLADTSGRTSTLSSFAGKVVILTFWATWCPSCKEEMPRLNALHEELKPRGVAVIAVSSDYSEAALKEYLAVHPAGFPVLYDKAREVTRLYKVSYLPVTFLIDRRGRIVEKFAGEIEWPSQEMKKKIEKLL